MDIRKVSEEVKSEGLRSIIESLWEIVDRVRSRQIDHRQAQSETAAHKHMIQSIALDWLYHRKANEVNLLRLNTNKTTVETRQRSKNSPKKKLSKA